MQELTFWDMGMAIASKKLLTILVEYFFIENLMNNNFQLKIFKTYLPKAKIYLF